VLKPGGIVIGVVGPPDAGFATQVGAPKPLGIVMNLLSRKVRRQAKKLGVRYSFFFMRASGAQLRELAALYDAGVLRPVMDRTFPFDQTLDALAYVEQGRATGKVVITIDKPIATDPPSVLDPVEERARAVLRTGWRPPLADGPTRDELVELIGAAPIIA
jgi:hypothetical protein